jgi:hypothetical protein
MIRKFKSTPLSGAGYHGSLLCDHQAEARREGERSIMGTAKEFSYLWAKCDWCGQQTVLDDEGEDEPHLKFEKLLGWTSYATMPPNTLFHFCTRKCRIAFIDRHGSATVH